ncbi:MAG TPA: glycosyltransferase [Burkholderiaceae bacterium]|nr:glycosyltransferase [Burkholderiaceae bacterium]
MPASDQYAITFACYNQLDYTRQCVDSLVATGVDLKRVAVVDNGSTDGTQAYLEQQPFGAVILNQVNLGCGVAWNQGALALQAPWTIVMNNDVICAPGWLDGLIATAQARRLQIVSPSMVEGPLDYDFAAFAEEARHRMAGTVRDADAHAVCMAIHADVWQEVGYFMPVPRLLGYEDAIFFHKARQHGLRMGIAGASWLHHYGMTTQKALKLERHLSNNASLGDRGLLKGFLQQKWIGRQFARRRLKALRRRARAHELAEHGISVHGLRNPAGFEWI